MNLKKRFLNIAVLGTFMGLSGLTHAAVRTFEFTASDFTYAGFETPVSVPAIYGSFTLDGVNLAAIDLSIDGHVYSVAEAVVGPIEYDGISSPLMQIAIGGSLNGYNISQFGTDDFYFSYADGFAGGNGGYFTYTSAASGVGYQATNVMVSLRTSEVPVPAAAWLFGSGLLGLLGIGRNKYRSV